MRRVPLLAILFCCSCGPSSSGSSSSAEATATASRTSSAKPPEGAELEAVIQASQDFQPRRYFVHRSGYVSPGEIGVMHTLERNDYIKINAETPEYKTTTAGASMIVSLTDRAKALPGLDDTHETWGLPLARQRVISVAIADPPKGADGSYQYEVVYDWQNEDIGSLIGSELSESNRAPDGQYQIRMTLQSIKSGWLARTLGRPTRIDR